ncbi:RING finger protein 10 isoform X2 [Cataglyphis hispanica]|uniref:RING finger protein 10 isoform X2 n=1 Tax=Cataglyphis hispanica TaxID=1086592 RepID=UPI0021808A44|nr:RING finger protein 10 isoform X2 [Cataglyphis hispanica]
MDVKTKLTPSPAEGTATDARENRDVNNELYLGTLRKREPTSANKFARNEQPAKYNVQKAKDFVKRQRPKGQHHGGAEKNSKVVKNNLPEYDSVLVQGRKVNGNYLLNFHYARNKTRDAQSRDVGRHSCNNDRLLPPVQRHKYNKEQFIQASCQFVVTASGDYSLYLTNADILVDWKLIEQVKLHNSENLSCPICLHAPVAGKMTRCGHVYCWPCILRYLRYCQETGNYKCPICDEYLHKDDLKSVVEITRNTYNLGDTIKLRLMRREKTSLFATPVEPMIHPPTTFLSVSKTAANQIYSKLLIANIKDIMDIIERERLELELELRDNPDMAFDIEQALNELLKRKEKLCKDTESKDTLSMESTIKKDITEETPQGNEINVNKSCKEDGMPLVKQSSTDSVSSDSQSVSNPPKFLYFYQAEDGQHLYLDRLNVSMLKKQYGSLEYCPPVITGKLLEKQASISTANLRKKLPCLSHLPLTCLFESVEIELKPPLVSEEVLSDFHEQLNLRQKNREQKKREENKREKKIIEVENRLIGIYPTPNIDIESHQHFPELQAELQFSNEHVLSLSESATSSIASSPPLSAFDEIPKQETDHSSHGQIRTFADITKKLSSTVPIKTYNKKSTNAWPSVKSKKCNTSTTSSNKDEEEVSPEVAAKTHDKSANAWPVKSKTYSGTTSTSSSNEDEKRPYISEPKDESIAAGKKKKKKKNKGTVLLTTGMTSGYSL